MAGLPDEHPSVLIAEEMRSRGWSRDDLAAAMVGDDRDAYMPTRLALDLYLDVGPTNPWLSIGDTTSARLATAFGTSPQFFRRLHGLWVGTREEPR